MRRCRALPIVLLGLGLLAQSQRPLAAQSAARQPLTPAARRALQLPLYEAVKADPQYQSFAAALEATPLDAGLRERFLRFMPLSPLDFLEIDMQVRRYEIAVPKFLHDEHVAWIRLHDEDARKLYGDVYVDSVLAEWAADTGEAIEDADLASRASISTNRNVASTASPAPLNFQGEIQIAVNPLDPNQMVAAANTWDTISGTCGNGIQAVFYSSNGGITWGYTCAPSAAAYGMTCSLGYIFGSDPAVFWNDANEVFLNYMLLCSNGSTTTRYAMVVAKSTNGGATWAGQGVIQNSWSSSNVEDKNFYIIDTNTASPFYNRHYTCWDRNNNERMAYSTNSGVSWTQVDIPAAAVGTFDLGCEMAVDDDGTLHVIFDTLDCGSTSCTNERMFYTRSTNGGVSWSTPVLVQDFNLVSFSGANFPDAQDNRGANPFGAIAIDNSGGPCNGTLYAAFSDFGSGQNVNDTDVWVTRSTNNGATWNTPVRVNDGGLAGRAQFHPFLQVDPTNGRLVVAWHDARNDTGNDAVEIFTTRSTDCGASFEPNLQVSQPSAEFNNSGISYMDENTADNPNRNPNQYGEYLGLDALGNRAYIAWVDTRHFYPGSSTNAQKENLGFVSVEFNPCKNGAFVGMLYRSLAAEDGYILESSETSNVGGAFSATNATTLALRVGDSSADQQYKSILSFDTSGLPDLTCVRDARLMIKRGGLVGTSPFTTHGSLRVDVRTGGFNGNTALEAADFQAAATVSTVCTLSNAPANGDWSECYFSDPAAMAAINRTGRTQFRISFARDDNDDLGNDLLGYYSGEAVTANQPVLILSFLP